MSSGSKKSSFPSITWRELISMLSTIEKSLEFAWQYKLLPDRDPKTCVECRTRGSVKLTKKTADSDFPLQLHCNKCRRRTSIRKNTWFECCKTSIEKNMILVSCWVRNYTLEAAASETDLSMKTVIDYYGFCREVCYVIVTNSSVLVGGEGKIVEIVESHITTKKHCRGQPPTDEVEQISVFGGIERESLKCFIVRVHSSARDTLVPLIKHFILPGSKIITDGFTSYQALKDEGFEKDFVNHKVEFVSSDDLSIHTKKVGRLWKSLKSNIKREGRPGDSDEMYLFQYMYFHNLRVTGRKLPCHILPVFLRDIGRVYPGYGAKGLKPAAYANNGMVEGEQTAEGDNLAVERPSNPQTVEPSIIPEVAVAQEQR